MLNSLKKSCYFGHFLAWEYQKSHLLWAKFLVGPGVQIFFFLKPSLHTETDISVSYILFQGELQFCQAKAQGLSFGNNG